MGDHQFLTNLNTIHDDWAMGEGRAISHVFRYEPQLVMILALPIFYAIWDKSQENRTELDSAKSILNEGLRITQQLGDNLAEAVYLSDLAIVKFAG
ncbi:MAG: hypothetical protein R2911_43475 [Caldilineaceae bacterium]